MRSSESTSFNSVEAIRAIRSESASANIVVLTMYQGDEDIYRALEAGATTYPVIESAKFMGC